MTLQTIAPLHNTLRHYAWGARTAMSEILQRPPSGQPEAELWMGAHPSAPSLVEVNGQWQPLDQLIAEEPISLLGERVTRQFGGRLPFLFKVLAADQPLSLQAHPNKAQAEAGFLAENRQGVPLASPHRNYRDNNHKPEVICALTEFWALRGFRPAAALLPMLDAFTLPALAAEVAACRQDSGKAALRQLFAALLKLGPADRDQVVAEVLRFATARAADDAPCRWLVRLQQFYPGDIGIAGAALLNVVRLAPGEAMCMPAGELHAYLQGVGMELMANSDNVLRGGLTPKHIDVPELLKTLTFCAAPVSLARTRNVASGVRLYETPFSEFQLAAIDLDAGQLHVEPAGHGVEILFCLEGPATLSGGNLPAPLTLAPGESVFVPAAAAGYEVRGPAVLYRASVP